MTTRFLLGVVRATVRACSLFVPQAIRGRWVEEWIAELWHETERARTLGVGSRLALLGAVRGVLNDARAMRHPEAPEAAGGSVRAPRRNAPTERIVTIVRDVQRASRGLRRSYRFTAVAVATLALGIGANTAIFSVVNAVLLEPLPYPNADRLMALGHRAPGTGSADRWGISEANYFYYRSEIESLADLGAFREVELTFTGPGDAERLTVVTATSTLFSTLGARAAIGRLFTTADDALDGTAVAVLSHDVWTRQFGSDPNVLGSIIRLDGLPREVVGVAAEGLHLPDRKVDVWVPLRLNPNAIPNDSHSFSAIVRLSETATLRDARDELGRHVEQFPKTLPTAYSESFMERARFVVDIESLQEDVVGDVSSVLWIILSSVSLVLLIALANVANLLLMRAESGRREVALREALGASRADLARYLLAESLVLAMAGGVVGVFLAGGGLRVLLAAAPESLPRLETVGIDGKALAFAFAVSVATGLVFGLIPLLRLRPGAAIEALKEGSRGAVSAPGRHGARKLLVVGQVAMSLMLLVAAGLMWQSFHQLRDVQPGFRPDGALVLDIALPAYEYRGQDAAYGFYREFFTRLEQLNAVDHAGGISVMPLEEGVRCYLLSVKDRAGDANAGPCVPVRWTAPGYFAAMGIPLVAGRGFELRDNDQRNGAVVLSQVLAEQLWPGEEAIGREVRIFGAREPWYHVVGVAAPVRAEGLEEPPAGSVYFPLLPLEGAPAWSPRRNLSIVVRTTTANPLELAFGVRQVVLDMDPDVPVANVRTLRQIFDHSMADTALAMVLIGIAATVALVLGAVGIYGVIAYVVSQRVREIGIRMALGAAAGTVSRRVLGESMRVVAIGVSLGMIGAVALQRVIETVLFGVSGLDPAIFGLAAVSLIAIAAVASYLPARRAARVDPMTALRSE